MKVSKGEEFLDYLYSNLHLSDEVKFTELKQDNNGQKILKYLNRIENILNRAKNNERNRHIIRLFFHRKYIIQELPPRIITIYGIINNHELNEKEQEELLNKIQNNQRNSLDKWIDFIIDKDYPMWFKYYIMRGVLNSGIYNKLINKITRRTKTTKEPFLEINEEVIEEIYNYLNGIIEENSASLNVDELSFQRLYVKYLNKRELSNNGKWVKFSQNSSPEELCKSINGKNTGWCTVWGEDAKTQLRMGDIHIYFTKGKTDEYDTPRIAIRMSGSTTVSEIRGILNQQNLEEEMLPVVEEKIKDFYIGSYKKTIAHFKKLSELEDKLNRHIEFTIEDLCFLYQIDDLIESFGYEEDARIKKIRARRNIVDDLNRIFKEVDCQDKNLFLNYLTDATGINFPSNFKYLDLSGLKSVSGLVLNNHISGSIQIDVEEIDNYTFPEIIEGSLVLCKLKRMKNVSLPKHIAISCDLEELESFENSTFPEYAGDSFIMPKVSYLENMHVPKSKRVSLTGVKRARNLIFSESDSIDMAKLVEGENIVFPRVMKNNLNLSTLHSISGIILPEEVGELELRQIKDLSIPFLPPIVKTLCMPLNRIEDIEDIIANVSIDRLFLDRFYKKEDIINYLKSKNKVKELVSE